MKRSDNTEQLGKVIERLLKAYRLEDKFNEAGLINSWEKILGKAIANRTEKLYIRDRKLFVSLNSASLRQELSMARSRLVELLNEQFAGSIIDDVVFL
ncbi:MAG: DUF721 domain-containing protein [Bacteroidota bacterium]